MRIVIQHVHVVLVLWESLYNMYTQSLFYENRYTTCTRRPCFMRIVIQHVHIILVLWESLYNMYTQSLFYENRYTTCTRSPCFMRIVIQHVHTVLVLWESLYNMYTYSLFYENHYITGRARLSFPVRSFLNTLCMWGYLVRCFGALFKKKETNSSCFKGFIDHFISTHYNLSCLEEAAIIITEVYRTSP